jgi:hypothetical protein
MDACRHDAVQEASDGTGSALARPIALRDRFGQL